MSIPSPPPSSLLASPLTATSSKKTVTNKKEITNQQQKSTTQIIEKNNNDTNNEINIDESLIISDTELLNNPQQFHHPYSNIKVLLITESCNSGESLSVIQNAVQQEILKTNRKPDIIVTPEHWLKTSQITSIENNKTLQEISKYISEFVKCYCFIGFTEKDKNKIYNAMCCINPNGKILGVYRKRIPTATESSQPGNKIGVFNTIFGRIAVLICFDIENKHILEENLRYKPFLIINPTFISGHDLLVNNNLNSNLNKEENIHFKVKISLESISRLFEVICFENNITILRCDNSLQNGGKGTHQLITPYSTIYGSNFNDCNFCFHVDYHPSINSNNNCYFKNTNEPSIHRSAVEDNIGNRYLVYPNDKQINWFCKNNKILFYSVNRIICSDGNNIRLVNSDILYCKEEMDCFNLTDKFGKSIVNIFLIEKKLICFCKNLKCIIFDMTKEFSFKNYIIIELNMEMNEIFQIEKDIYGWKDNLIFKFINNDFKQERTLTENLMKDNIYPIKNVVINNENYLFIVSENNLTLMNANTFEVTTSIQLQQHSISEMSVYQGIKSSVFYFVNKQQPCDILMIDINNNTKELPTIHLKTIQIITDPLENQKEDKCYCFLPIDENFCFIGNNLNELKLLELKTLNSKLIMTTRHTFHPNPSPLVKGIVQFIYDEQFARLFILYENRKDSNHLTCCMYKFISNRYPSKLTNLFIKSEMKEL
ncbi:hypothetical protein ABK040_002930 [Willaertia magna]